MTEMTTGAGPPPPPAESPEAQDILLQSSLAHHREGRSDQAAAGYRAILAKCPAHADALHLLGMLHHQAGDGKMACRLIASALRQHPEDPLYLNSMGLALAGAGEHAAAAACFQNALKQRPGDAEATLNLSMVLADAGSATESEALLRQLLAQCPGHPRAGAQLGELLLDRGDIAGAATFLGCSLAADPHQPDALNTLALVRLAAGRPSAAATLLSAALGQRPGFAEAWCNLGMVYQETGRPDAAADCYRKALSLEPRSVAGLNNLGIVAQEMNALEEAIDCHRRVLSVAPDNGKALARLAHLYQKTADWEALADIVTPLMAVTRQQIAAGVKTDQDPFLNLSLTDDPEDNIAVAATWSTATARRAGDAAPPADAVAGREDDPIVVGYLSGNFRDHPNAQLVMGLFSRHDRRRFRVHGYALGADDGSDYRRRIAAGCERFVDLSDLDHAAAAQRIRDDGVHILVDLMGYTKGSRPDICARRPAPVQVRLLGFPASSGGDLFDYIVTDRWITPEGAGPHYSEKCVFMPHCYQPNSYRDMPAPLPVERAAAGLPATGFVFGCFNQPYKITSAVFDRWLSILHRVPGSVLWLLSGHPLFEANIRRRAEAAGVSHRRIVFAPRQAKHRHMNRLPAMDLMLDTMPVCGHITTTDALWAGVPVLTMPGRNFASRASMSYLMNLGLPELVATSETEYIDAAVHIATNPSVHRNLQGKLARRRWQSPLFDVDRYVRHLEAAFTLMQARAARGGSPEAFSVA